MNPKAIIYSCSWSSYPGLQLTKNPLTEPESDYKIIINMCSGRISPELILETFKCGAWGVLIASCPDDKCEHDGNYKTRRRVILLKRTLEQFGIEPQRLKLELIDKSESAKLKQAIDKFVSEMNKLGPIDFYD